MDNTSMFGYQSDSPAARAAYDMMVLKDMGLLDKEESEDEKSDRPFPFGRYSYGRY